MAAAWPENQPKLQAAHSDFSCLPSKFCVVLRLGQALSIEDERLFPGRCASRSAACRQELMIRNPFIPLDQDVRRHATQLEGRSAPGAGALSSCARARRL